MVGHKPGNAKQGPRKDKIQELEEEIDQDFVACVARFENGAKGQGGAEQKPAQATGNGVKIDEQAGQQGREEQVEQREVLGGSLTFTPGKEGSSRNLRNQDYYVDTIKSIHRKRYMLVIIDQFSRWVEATTSKDHESETIVKFLIQEIIPRFGIPSEMSSDNGSAFVQKVAKGVLQQLGIKQRLGCVYHPQSQGMVETVNGTLKEKIKKICASTKLNWVDALPLALMSYRMQTNRITHLTPHKMLMGRPMPAPHLRGPSKGPPLEQLQMELKEYMRKLTTTHKAIYLQEKTEFLSSAL